MRYEFITHVRDAYGVVRVRCRRRTWACHTCCSHLVFVFAQCRGLGMTAIRNNDVDALLTVLARIDDVDELFSLLEDLFTVREIKESSQRLAVARLLSAGKSYAQVEEKTGASATTIARVSKCLSYGSGGYEKALAILSDHNGHSAL